MTTVKNNAGDEFKEGDWVIYNGQNAQIKYIIDDDEVWLDFDHVYRNGRKQTSRMVRPGLFKPGTPLKKWENPARKFFTGENYIYIITPLDDLFGC